MVPFTITTIEPFPPRAALLITIVYNSPLENEEDEITLKLGKSKCTTETYSEKELYNQQFVANKKDWEETELWIFVIEIRN